MRIVLDTNVLVSAFHFGGRPRRLFEEVLRGQHRLVLGQFILDELSAVLKQVCAWEDGPVTAVRSELETLAEIVRPGAIPKVCRDADDNEVLAIADGGGAEAIITGDNDLLELRQYRGIKILSVAEFEGLEGMSGGVA